MRLKRDLPVDLETASEDIGVGLPHEMPEACLCDILEPSCFCEVWQLHLVSKRAGSIAVDVEACIEAIGAVQWYPVDSQ